jgi:anti-anti-sigma factor
MQIVEITQDMDAATMAKLKPRFEEMSLREDDIRLDLRGVRFIDSSGIGGIVFLFKRLREKSLNLTLANVTGQPLSLMRQLQLGFLIATADAA